MDLQAITGIIQENEIFISGIKIVGIILAICLANHSLKIFIEEAVKRTIKAKGGKGSKKRAETLISVFQGTFKFVISIVGFLMILSEFGIDIAPLLAGVGLIGLAIGMASKDIVSDFISGLFVLLENQYRIGDEVKIGSIQGEVEEITLRRTVIKGDDGLLYLIPNNQIKTVAKINN